MYPWHGEQRALVAHFGALVTRCFLIKSQAYPMHHAAACTVSAHTDRAHATCSRHNSVHRLNVYTHVVISCVLGVHAKSRFEVARLLFPYVSMCNLCETKTCVECVRLSFTNGYNYNLICWTKYIKHVFYEFRKHISCIYIKCHHINTASFSHTHTQTQKMQTLGKRIVTP